MKKERSIKRIVILLIISACIYCYMIIAKNFNLPSAMILSIVTIDLAIDLFKRRA